MAESEEDNYEGGEVRMVREGRVGERGQCEAILDLGADTSVLPLDFAALSEV